MPLVRTLKRFVGSLRRDRTAFAKRKSLRPEPEALKDCSLPALVTLNAAGELTYTATADRSDDLILRHSTTFNRYFLENSGDTILLFGVSAPSGSGSDDVAFSSLDVTSIVLNLGTQADQVRVYSFVDPLTVNGQSGDDTVILGDPSGLPAGQYTLDHIDETATVNGGTGNDSLEIKDNFEPMLLFGSRPYTVTESSVSWSNALLSHPIIHEGID